ncbi:MAG: nucleoside kinase [Firmicutes bacterium]|nr:nucleoside kinase [Bacillota bacterium]
MDKIRLTIEGRVYEYAPGLSLAEISRDFVRPERGPIVGAKVGNDLRDLWFVPTGDAVVTWIDLTHPDGTRIYARSLSFVLIRAVRELFPGARVTIEHSLCKGLFGEIHHGRELTAEDIEALAARMTAIIARDEPFQKTEIPVAEAIDLFARDGQEDKVRLLRYRTTPTVKVYWCGDFPDYFYGYTVPSTGYLKVFGLQLYKPGFLLRFPLPEDPTRLPSFVDQPKLARIFYEFERWGQILEIDDVGALNDQIAAGNGPDLIRVSEALHEKKIAQIADMIYLNRERARLVFIAGPSSSGKTTFIQRLAIQLRVLGLRPVTISLDDYFVPRELTPRGEDGKPDFEALEAIDLEFFNRQLLALLRGEEVEVPRYDFVQGRPAPVGRRLRLAARDGLILVEGIHALNERLTPAIPREEKFKIYVSALTQLNIDHHNRIPTTDTRILRRIVRDHKFRGHAALQTLRLWAGVRRGEERNIFPFQEEADVMFNSALPYELSVLKPFAEPLLQEIGPEVEEYSEAKRLLKFLSYFLPLGAAEVPTNSILREFIGESCFRV